MCSSHKQQTKARTNRNPRSNKHMNTPLNIRLTHTSIRHYIPSIRFDWLMNGLGLTERLTQPSLTFGERPPLPKRLLAIILPGYLPCLYNVTINQGSWIKSYYLRVLPMQFKGDKDGMEYLTWNTVPVWTTRQRSINWKVVYRINSHWRTFNFFLNK